MKPAGDMASAVGGLRRRHWRGPGRGRIGRASGILSAVVGCWACGGEPGLGVGVTIADLDPASVGAVQITFLKNGSSFNCATLSQSCLNTQVSTADVVMLTLSDNKQHPAALLPASGTSVAGSGQSFTIQVPVGQNYLIVAEVLSNGQPTPQLLASGCDLRNQIVAGNNPPESITAHSISPAPNCDPRWEK